jgi:transglutaminase-like putative cysteine protease
VKLRLPASGIEESPVARGFVWAGFAVAVGALAVYAQDLVLAPLALGVAAIGHLVSHRRRRQRRGVLSQLLILSLMLACLAYFLLDSFAAAFGGQLPQAHFAALLVAVTSFDLKTRRNLHSSLWISLALVYLAAVYAWDYPFGVLAGLWALCLAGFWISSHLRRLDASFAFPRRAVGLLLVGGLGLGVAAFTLLPQPSISPGQPLVISLPSQISFRGEIENPALPLVQFAAAPGDSRVDLHYRGRLGDAVVMYVRSGAPAYWRGLVFDHYENGSWSTSERELQTFPSYVGIRLTPPPEGAVVGTFVQVVRPLRPLGGVIYAAHPVASLYYPAAELRRDSYGAWFAPGSLQPGQTYSAVSYLTDLRPETLRGPSSDLGAGLPPEYLNPGPLSRRARELAGSLAGAGDEYERVMAITHHLQSHYRYSLELGHVPPGRDPVDWFLFDTGVGYCEQFATAATLMLRALGIPARLSTGYSTGSYDPVLDQAVVRERDAHAWVEVHFPGRGWVPVDPSPGFVPLAAARFPNRWAASGLARLVPHLSLGTGGAALGSLGWLGAAPGLLGLLVGLVAALAWGWTRLTGAIGSARPESQVLALYNRLQRRLGRRRRPPETPREYAAAQAGARLEPLLAEVTEAVNQGVYGGRWPSPEELAAWRQRLS